LAAGGQRSGACAQASSPDGLLVNCVPATVAARAKEPWLGNLSAAHRKQLFLSQQQWSGHHQINRHGNIHLFYLEIPVFCIYPAKKRIR
jgi:hypothetical protein